jgi:hypothetical protein
MTKDRIFKRKDPSKAFNSCYAVFADHFSPCPVNQGEIFLT